MAAELTVTTIDTDGTIAVSGELDTHTAPQLAEHLAGIAEGTAVVLDLSGTTFISSAGLSTILNAQRQLSSSGGSLRVASPTVAVARLIELSGLNATLGLS